MNTEKTCAFTGHRIIKENLDVAGISQIVEQFIEEGYDTFLCGMAMGFDLIAAEIVLKMKEKYGHIKLIACVPCPSQERYFPEEQKKRYSSIIEKCDEVRILNDHYYNGCMQMRDRYMVDNSSLVIAYYRTHTGGTYYTVNYAAKNNKKLCVC